MPIKEFYLDKVLEGFEMSQDEFIDLCILLGCDYVDKIKVGMEGNIPSIHPCPFFLNTEYYIIYSLVQVSNFYIQGIGPKKAIELVKKYKTIEKIVENIDQTKYPIPHNWMYNEAR